MGVLQAENHQSEESYMEILSRVLLPGINFQLCMSSASMYSFCCFLYVISTLSLCFDKRITSDYNNIQRFNLTPLVYDNSRNYTSPLCLSSLHAVTGYYLQLFWNEAVVVGLGKREMLDEGEI